MSVAPFRVGVGALVVSLCSLSGCADQTVAPPVVQRAPARSVPTSDLVGLPPSGAWSPRAPLPTARYGLVATVFDGRIYTVGGATALVEFQTVGAVATNVVEVYDPSTNSWSEAAPTPFGHVYANGVSVIDGKLYLPGGAGCDAPGCGGSTALYIFDPADGPLGSWTLGPSMPIPIHGGTGGAINGKLYVLAGWSVGAPRNRFFRFDPATSEWTELAPSPHGHTFGASAVLDDRFYATGAEGITSFLDIYDPATDTWTSRVMPVGYQHHSAIAAKCIRRLAR